MRTETGQQLRQSLVFLYYPLGIKLSPSFHKSNIFFREKKELKAKCFISGAYFCFLALRRRFCEAGIRQNVFVEPHGLAIRKHWGEHFVPGVEHFAPGVEHFVPCKTFFRYKTPCVMHFVPPKTFSRHQIGKFDSFGGKRGAFLPQILNSANTHRDTIQVLQRQEQELRTRIAKHLSGQVRAPGASPTLQH